MIGQAEHTAMKILIIINDPPYGNERVFNALRLSHALAKADPSTAITIFLMTDSVVSAKSGQKTPDGYYNIERMLKRVVSSGGAVLLCGACIDARGIALDQVIVGAQRSTVDQLAAETLTAEKVLVF